MFLLDITGQSLSRKLHFFFTQSTEYFLKIPCITKVREELLCSSWSWSELSHGWQGYPLIICGILNEAFVPFWTQEPSVCPFVDKGFHYGSPELQGFWYGQINATVFVLHLFKLLFRSLQGPPIFRQFIFKLFLFAK